jgi:hypothetical protein
LSQATILLQLIRFTLLKTVKEGEVMFALVLKAGLPDKPCLF